MTGHITQERYPPRALSFLRKLNKKQALGERWCTVLREVFGVLIVLLDFVCSKCQAFRHPPRPCPHCRSSELAEVQAGKWHSLSEWLSAPPPTFHENLSTPTKSNCVRLQRSRSNNHPWKPTHIFCKKNKNRNKNRFPHTISKLVWWLLNRIPLVPSREM